MDGVADAAADEAETAVAMVLPASRPLARDRASKSQLICHVLTDQRRMLATRVHQS